MIGGSRELLDWTWHYKVIFEDFVVEIPRDRDAVSPSSFPANVCKDDRASPYLNTEVKAVGLSRIMNKS